MQCSHLGFYFSLTSECLGLFSSRLIVVKSIDQSFLKIVKKNYIDKLHGTLKLY